MELTTLSTEVATQLAWGELPQPDELGCLSTPCCASHGYALFSPTPRSAKDKQLVWRVSKALGYGMPQSAAGLSATSVLPVLDSKQPRHPDLICLDDAGGNFRNPANGQSDIWCVPARWA